jgi:beta-lactamase class A
VSTLAAVPASVPTVPRLAGADRYAMSVSASRAAFPNGSDAVLIASGAAPTDGIIAAGMAARLGAPLLYVAHGGIPTGIAAELSRLTPQSIIVVGGPGSVSDGVLAALGGYAADVTRFGGVDRYDASRAALRGGGVVQTVYLSGGAQLVDAPLAAVAAAANQAGFLLVNGAAAAADAATLATLREVGAGRLVVVGGLGTVSASFEASLRSAGFAVERRVAADRYLASVLMAKERSAPPQRAIVSNWQSLSDVTVATALASVTGQPLLYATEPCMPDGVSAHIASLGVGVTAVGGPAWLGSLVLANRACGPERTAQQNQLASAIRSTMSGYQGSFTVTVRQIGGLAQTVNIGGGIRREPASMMKIFAAWAALKRVEQGAATLSTRLPSGVALGTCIQVMIHASDNYCHSDIAHWIGIANLNRMIRDAGFTNTVYGTVPPGTSVLYAGNRSSTNDLVELMRRLAGRTILSKPYADHLVNLMRTQIWRSRIASGIPPGVPQASKPGALWIASGLLQADTAIVNGPKFSYIISIIGDNGPPQAALRAISRTVYQHFNGAFGAAASYPVQQMVTTAYAPYNSAARPSIIGWIPAGTPIQVHDAQREFYLIQWGARQVWMHISYLRNR